MMDFDWQQVEQYAFDYIIDCVEQIHQQHPDEKIYGAMFHCFYGDGKYIYFPPIFVGTEELLQRVVASYQLDNGNQIKELSNKLRWSGADLADYMFDEGAMFDKCSELAKQVTEHAKEASGYDFDDESTEENFDKWQKIYQEFLMCFPKACQRATQYLLSTNMVGRDFIAVAIDEEYELVSPSLTQEQLAKHFPTVS